MALQVSVIYSASLKGSIWPSVEHCLSGDDSLFMGTSGWDLTQAESSHKSCTRQALSIAREKVPTQTKCYLGLGLSLLIL